MAKQYTLKVLIPTLDDERVAAVILPVDEIQVAILQVLRRMTYEEAAYINLMGELPTDEWLEAEFEIDINPDYAEKEAQATVRILSYNYL